MKKILLLLLPLIINGCKKEDIERQKPCIDCSTEFWISNQQHSVEYKSDGFWHLEFSGLKYFQVMGNISEVTPEFNVNGVPLVSTYFDSDMWYLADTLAFKINIYNKFGDYSDKSFRQPIVYKTKTVYVTNFDKPINATGYTYGDINFVNSKYTYSPKCEVLVNKESIGDTIQVFTKTQWGEYPDVVEKIDTLKVIVE